MKSTLLFLQVMMMCSVTICWGSCSLDREHGRCSIALNGTNLDEVVAKIMARLRTVLPKPENTTSQGCQSKCWTSEVPGENRTRSAMEKVDQVIANMKQLTKKLEESMNEEIQEEKVKEKVKEFTSDRDWSKLRQVLEASLPAGDPVLEQARGISWTDGKDVLMELVFSGHVQLLEWLLDHDLDSNLPWGPNNSTMLHAAASAGRSDIADLLFKRGAVVDARADWNTTPLLRAAASYQPAMVRWLLDHGADVHAVDTNGWTALHHAARVGDLESAQILVNYGVMKEALSNKGHTAHDEALDFGHQSVADYLAPDDPFTKLVEAQ